jgi:hypothetical protein
MVAEDEPTEALVWPPLLSHGFGGDGVAISPVVIVATHRTVIRERGCRERAQRSRETGRRADEGDVKRALKAGRASRKPSLRGCRSL